jgi:CheY-like chemotaxis protein
VRILYVEDNATNVILVQRVANMGKHEVITYPDGQEALDHFQQDKPDLVLLDVQLRGGLTGLDVAHTLRVKGTTTPIIAVTAYAMKGDRQRCLDAGCDDYLPKPISVAELVTVFKRYGDAVASGKPILSTFKLQPVATPMPAQATSLPPIVLTPVPSVVATVAVDSPTALPIAVASVAVVPPVEALSVVTPSVSPQPVVEKTPASLADAVTPSSKMVIESVAVDPPSDAVAQRTPAPVNAEP